MPQNNNDPRASELNVRAFCERWRPGMLLEINDYRGPRRNWKQRSIILMRKASPDIWSALELNRKNCRLIAKGKIPAPVEITVDYIALPNIYFVCRDLPVDLGQDNY